MACYPFNVHLDFICAQGYLNPKHLLKDSNISDLSEFLPPRGFCFSSLLSHSQRVLIWSWDDLHCHSPPSAHWDMDRDNTSLTGTWRGGVEGQVLGFLEEDAEGQWSPGRHWTLSWVSAVRLTPSHSEACVTERHFHTWVIEGLSLPNLASSLQKLKPLLKTIKKSESCDGRSNGKVSALQAWRPEFKLRNLH